jgi:pimeloyl-ACP methyl ester carboxylesterase
MPRRERYLVSVAVTVAALAATGCSNGTPAPSASTASASPGATVAPRGPAGPPPVTLAQYYAQKLRWTPCHRGFQCARLLVPFDYQRPAWRRFSLPVIRLPATDPKQRLGALVVNPGGPGGSGISYALQAKTVATAAVRARFDLVGFDPRGVGGSIPAVQCLNGPQLDKFFETPDEPSTPAQRAAVVRESKLFDQACEQHSSALLPYVGTENAARDMDVLRAALGDAKLTYLGKSYGTFLGTWYAQLFPSHVRALVLDGAVDPDESSLNMNTVQARGFQVALRSFIANCLTQSTCPFSPHSTVSADVARIQKMLNQAARKPLTSQVAGQTAVAGQLLTGIATALYSKSFWPYLREGLTAAFGGNGTVLVELADVLEERSPNGHYSNLTAAELAVDCLDRPWPRSLSTWVSAAASAAKAAPMFGAPIMWGSLPCAYWPLKAAPTARLRGAGAPPILVVGTTRDPATPIRWAKALARDLSSGVLLEWNGDGHTAYMSGSSCVDNVVDSYLISLKVPRSGTLCQ